MAENSDLLIKIFGCYPSFHDSAVLTFRLQRKRRSYENMEGERLPVGQARYLVDLQLEILHNRYAAPRSDGGSDYMVVVDLLDIMTSEMDVNAMLAEASISDITLSKRRRDLINFDLMPNIGLDIKLSCKEILIVGIKPYKRNEF
nr:Imm50 family immunity protein [Paraburkholderia hiiakae]